MQYAKLTHKDFILAHFDASYPKIGKALYIKNTININSIDDDGNHILDWVLNGYCGEDAYKVEIFFQLCSLGAKISLVKDTTFEKIMHILGASNYFNNRYAQQFMAHFDDYYRLKIFLKDDRYGKKFIDHIDFNNKYAPHRMMILKNIAPVWNNNENAVNYCLHSFLSSKMSSWNKKYIFVIHSMLSENSSLCLENFIWNNNIVNVKHCRHALDVIDYIIIQDEKKEPVFSQILSEILVLNNYNTLQSQLPIHTAKKSHIKI